MITNKKLSAISILLTGFGMWVVAGLWHNLLMPSLYEDTHAEHEGIVFMLIAYFILAVFMVYLYFHIFTKDKPIKRGLKLGAFVGVLWVFPYTFTMAGAHDTSMIYVFKNAIWHIIEQGTGGIIIALVIRNKYNDK